MRGRCEGAEHNANQMCRYRIWKREYDTVSAVLQHSLPMIRYLKNSHPEMRASLEERGGFFMMSKSGGLKPSAVAGRPSVTRLTQRSWTGMRASGMPRAAVRKML